MPEMKPHRVHGNEYRVVAQYDRIMLLPKGVERDEMLLEWVDFWGDALLSHFRAVPPLSVNGANL